MKEKDFQEQVLRASAERGIGLTREQAALCSGHIALMLEWNRKLNLTRITDPGEILEKHILDSLLPARRLPRSGYALDVGTGPGFPGIPLKILLPGLHMVLLEANRKKVSFLKVALAKLGMKEAWAVQGRWEEMEGLQMPSPPGRYALVTMRAVRLEPETLALAKRSLEPGGLFAWWAGPAAEGCSATASEQPVCPGLLFEEAFPYELPSATRPRRLLLWRRGTEAEL